MWRKNQFDKIQEMQGWAWVYLENKVVSNDGDLSHVIWFILQIEENISILL